MFIWQGAHYIKVQTCREQASNRDQYLETLNERDQNIRSNIAIIEKKNWIEEDLDDDENIEKPSKTKLSKMTSLNSLKIETRCALQNH